MEKEGKVERVSVSEAVVQLEPVLVDKHQHAGDKPRIYPVDADELKTRYRVTLDMRPVNKMELATDNKEFMWLPNKMASRVRTAKPTDQKQHQSSAQDILRSIPEDCTSFYAKIDLSEAFYAIETPNGIRRLASTRTQADDGSSVFWRFTRLVQGWTWSPIYFSRAVQYTLDIIREKLPKGVVVRHYQDDLLVCGSNADDVNSALVELSSAFVSYGFHVNEKKTVYATDTIVFCGFLLSKGYYRPCPSRKNLSKDAAEAAWLEFCGFIKNRAERQAAWLRSWTGRFQFLRGWLTPQLMEDLSKMCSYIKTTQSGIVVSNTDEQLQGAFERLCEHVIAGRLPALRFGIPGPRSLGTIVCTDGNKESWSGIILRLYDADTEEDQNISTSDDERLNNAVDELLTVLKSSGRYKAKNLVEPIRIVGGRFTATESTSSSTWRERAAQLMAIHEAQGYLTTPVTIVSDNMNVGRRWGDIQENFGGRWLNLIALYDRTVTDMIWVRRDGLPAFTDALARVFAGRGEQCEGATPIARDPGILVDSGNIEVEIQPTHVDYANDINVDDDIAYDDTPTSDRLSEISFGEDTDGDSQGDVETRAVLENLRAVYQSAELNNFLEEIKNAQSLDEETKYLGVRLSLVRQYLLGDAIDHNDKLTIDRVKKVTTRFLVEAGQKQGAVDRNGVTLAKVMGVMQVPRSDGQLPQRHRAAR
ncbi:hypothetical protein FOL47_005558 [Perkinsus chesapeaki]|uniref:Reverse transcriptase domain-containing protein n=1 Tax=Perkinsus chesapeaki TaxID=330153 RepID=A0A7J6LY90_PERCH|nr:hypothetical protein FOL47_005558 [Perkinsus chesapeaki]